MLLVRQGWVGKALYALFTCRRASSLAHSANGGWGRERNGPSQDGLGLGHTPTFTMLATATIPIAGPTHPPVALSKPACLLSRDDPGLADDRGIVWQPQKPPLASRRRGNWHRRLREQEMSGRSPCGAGSCSVSSALSGNRLPNYRALPATLSSCRLPPRCPRSILGPGGASAAPSRKDQAAAQGEACPDSHHPGTQHRCAPTPGQAWHRGQQSPGPARLTSS